MTTWPTQSINFEFLRPRWGDLAVLGGFAEQYAHPDPQSALVKLRLFAECMVDGIYQHLNLPKLPQAHLNKRPRSKLRGIRPSRD